MAEDPKRTSWQRVRRWLVIIGIATVVYVILTVATQSGRAVSLSPPGCQTKVRVLADQIVADLHRVGNQANNAIYDGQLPVPDWQTLDDANRLQTLVEGDPHQAIFDQGITAAKQNARNGDIGNQTSADFGEAFALERCRR